MTLLIQAAALEEARCFFEEAGSRGAEGTGMLAGVVEGEDQRATRFVAPDQRVGEGIGSWVEVTSLGKLQLAAALPASERYLARVHSHPGEAFHSPTDEANPALTADGAWSIVVPYFGLGLRRGLGACAVYRLTRGRWRQVNVDSLPGEIRVVDDA